ncbi:hypothetical protein BH10BAC5_BH10BAC5_08830 [soil metagenome]
MNLDDFIKKYDTPNSVVLLEGKREVADDDKPKLVDLGKLFASKTKHILFRSGNASGADQYFSEGVSSVDREKLQVITPYHDHRRKTNQAFETISVDRINLIVESEVVYQSKHNKKMGTLIDKYISGEIDRYSIKAAYIIRDTIKVIGTEEIMPATFAIFYDNLSNPRTGGTGHTMNICEKNNVSFNDQSVWMDWL